MEGSGPVWRAEQDRREREAQDKRLRQEHAQQLREIRQRNRFLVKRAEETEAQLDLLRILLAVRTGKLTHTRACTMMGLSREQFDKLAQYTIDQVGKLYDDTPKGATNAKQEG